MQVLQDMMIVCNGHPYDNVRTLGLSSKTIMGTHP